MRDRLNQHERAELGVPLVVLAELYYGAHKSHRREENLAGLKRLRETFTILPMTEAITDRYGAIRAALERMGLPKSDLDLIVVATDLENGGSRWRTGSRCPGRRSERVPCFPPGWLFLLAAS